MTKALARLCLRLAANRSGATAIEYGLIVALIVIAMIASLQGLANVTTKIWNNVSTQVSTSH
ncbi:Flp family type IVb pilin [Hephaestia mangrovi]|uniref:Flp family type IVb pilin n=1 Tax=Hephaestia mangrovi TaxID=2873268 RepID=UPI001CA6E95A|nr:Flp family type IVb pilin [Hephaestia mangrovi]MBY8827924.1 Flp family type IVb pilin [Hephaestia mangrovi]